MVMTAKPAMISNLHSMQGQGLPNDCPA